MWCANIHVGSDPGPPLTISTFLSVVRAYVAPRARKKSVGTKCLSMEGPDSADSS